jgi:hypothetical protein
MNPLNRLLLNAVALCALLTGGCAGSLNEARAAGSARQKAGSAEGKASPDRCATLDDRRQLFSGAGKALAVLGGGAGLSTIPIGSDRPELQTGVAIGAVVAGALAAGSMAIADGAGTSWAEQCSAP